MTRDESADAFGAYAARGVARIGAPTSGDAFDEAARSLAELGINWTSFVLASEKLSELVRFRATIATELCSAWAPSSALPGWRPTR